MRTFHIVEAGSFIYLGSVEAVDVAAASELATALWTGPVKVLTWRPSMSGRVAS